MEKDKGMELILYNLYVKAVSVILQARIRREDLPLKEKEKEANPPWFNLIEPVNLPKSEFSPWKEDLYHPLYLTFYLDLSKLTDQTVILKNNGSNQKLTLSQDFLSKKKYIILEEWILQWKPSPKVNDKEKSVYLNSIIYIRTLYTFCRMFRAHRLHTKLSSKDTHISIGYTISTSKSTHSNQQLLDKPIMDWSFDTSDQKTLPGSVQTPLGTFGISLNYRTNCDFEESQTSFPRDRAHTLPLSQKHYSESIPTNLALKKKSSMDDFSHFQHSLPSSLPDTQLKIKPFKLPPNEETKQETCLKSIEEAIQSEPPESHDSIERSDYIKLMVSIPQLSIFDEKTPSIDPNEPIEDKLEYFKRIGDEFAKEIEEIDKKAQDSIEINEEINPFDLTPTKHQAIPISSPKITRDGRELPHYPFQSDSSQSPQSPQSLEESFESTQEIFPIDLKSPLMIDPGFENFQK